MPNRKPRRPSYRYHKARDCAVVTIHGKDHYLGAYDSDESWELYHRLMAETYATAKPPVLPAKVVERPMTVNELMLRYSLHVENYYVKNGLPTSEQDTINQALGFVRSLYGSTPAHEFGPKRLKAVREAMIDHPIVRKVKVEDPVTKEIRYEDKIVQQGLARRFINKQIARIRRMFAWAVEEELLPAAIHAALLRVGGLKKKRTQAREKPRIRRVPADHVNAVLPLVQAVVRTMIEVQRLCGGRPQDVVVMRGSDIDRTGPVWEYRPCQYKSEHHNEEDDPDLERLIFLGPRAQALLVPYLASNPTGYLFSPQHSEHERNARRRQQRKTPLWSSHLRAQHTKKQTRSRPPLRDHYDVTSYRNAIRRACQKAGIPVGTPTSSGTAA